MQILLNAVDVFAAAVQLEERGAKFYARAAEQTLGFSRKLLQQLAEMENQHVARFQNLLTEFQESNASRGEINSDEEQALLKNLTSDKIITRDCLLSSEDGPAEILEKALQIEKNAVFFYTAVKDTLLESMSREAVDQLISEEMKHYRIISSALHALGKE